MSIRTALLAILDARGLLPAEVADRMSTRNRATFYRVLSGDTGDPRVSTVLAICDALALGPTDLLQLAELYESGTHQLSLIDLELRQAFAEIHELDEDGKRECLIVLRGVVSSRTQRKGAPLLRMASRQRPDA